MKQSKMGDEVIELAVLALKQRAARCRILPDGGEVTLRARRLWDVVPGEIATVRPRKQWKYGRHPYLSGTIESVRLDVAALGLTPLGLQQRGMWDPEDEYWGEPDDPRPAWELAVNRRGPRPRFEMEQILPGVDEEDPFDDPIIASIDLKEAGDYSAAYDILMGLCQADLRCLDAHAHLGNLCYDTRPEDAIRHYEVGFRIGELSLGPDFDGVLAWSWIDNRPFLRCMHSFGLCLWRLERFGEAARIFERMLWMNPDDQQGIRFLIDDVRMGVAWMDREKDGESG